MRRAALLLLLLAAGTAGAQTDADNDRAALITAKQAAADAERRAALLARAARAASDQATAARAQAAALALRVAAAEQDIRAAHARIALVGALQERQRRRLAQRQGPILHLVAALQTMARRPAALALAQPASARDLVHVQLLLADTMPVVAARTAGLRAELRRATALRLGAEQAAGALAASRVLLSRRRGELAQLEETATRRSQRLADQAAAEEQRALGLGADARDLADQIQVSQAAGLVRARLLALPGPAPRPGTDDPVPDHGGRARYRLPVAGSVAVGYGEVSPAGVRARGLTVATAAGARVVAPAPGFVLFAQRFRSYGDVVILAHGAGWTTTLTGLATVAVRPGERVAAGQAIGTAADEAPRVTTELRRAGHPVDVLAMAQAG